MLKHNRLRRHGERGQTLIMALAFIAFFALVVVAVFHVGEVTGLQQTHTAATASTDSGTEGGAAFAAADAGRSDVTLTCAAGNSGTVTMQDQSTASYKVNQCNPGLTGSGSSGPAPGANCILCVLNINNPAANPIASQVLFLQCAQSHGSGCGTDLSTTGGDIYVNGSLGGNGASITANPAGAHIAFLSGADYSGCTCSPTPVLTYAPAIGDPLSDGQPTDPVTQALITAPPVGCTSWNRANGCTMTLNNVGTAAAPIPVAPGLWASLNIQNSYVRMATGVYVFTGGLTLGGQSSLTATGVTIFLTCQGYGPNSTPCQSSSSGGFVSLGGQATASITAPGSAQYAPDNIAILADHKLVDPNVSQCIGSGQNCMFTSGGQGNGLSGTVDVHGGGSSLQGNAGASIGGRLITNSLNMQVSGNVGSGFSLSGTIPGISTSTCGVLDVAVSASAPISGQTGRAVVQSRCGSGSQSGVVFFDYKP